MPIAAAACNSLKITGKKSSHGADKSHIVSKPFPPGGAILVAKVVPESCQRTDGIDAWLEGKEEEKVKRMEREERKREKQDILNKVTEERIARNAERQKEIELRNLKKLIKEDSILNQDMIEEKEVIIKDLNTLIDNKGSLNPSCADCQDCSKGSLPGCQCQCRACEQARTAKEEKLAKLASPRGIVRCVKKNRGRRGKPDTIEYLVNIDLTVHTISKTQLADYKEIFTLFDKDQDGVLSLAELTVAMKTLGQRLSEADLLIMVKNFSEDNINNTIEFNEFLKMMSKQNEEEIKLEMLEEAFTVFDKDNDGFLKVKELRKVLLTMGQKMTKKEADEMVAAADIDKNGLISIHDFCSLLCYGKPVERRAATKTRRRDPARRLREESKEEYSSRSGSFSQG